MNWYKTLILTSGFFFIFFEIMREKTYKLYKLMTDHHLASIRDENSNSIDKLNKRFSDRELENFNI